jgi:hypothetical protein
MVMAIDEKPEVPGEPDDIIQLYACYKGGLPRLMVELTRAEYKAAGLKHPLEWAEVHPAALGRPEPRLVIEALIRLFIVERICGWQETEANEYAWQAICNILGLSAEKFKEVRDHWVGAAAEGNFIVPAQGGAE